jgi:hypothetical protein
MKNFHVQGRLNCVTDVKGKRELMHLIGTGSTSSSSDSFFLPAQTIQRKISSHIRIQLPLLLLRRNRSTEKKNRAGACAFHVVYVAARARHGPVTWRRGFGPGKGGRGIQTWMSKLKPTQSKFIISPDKASSNIAGSDLKLFSLVIVWFSIQFLSCSHTFLFT